MEKALVITTINNPTEGVRRFTEFAAKSQVEVVIVGDLKTPDAFDQTSLIFLSVDRQREIFPEFSDLLPFNHYSRKNLGYLYSIKYGADAIQESDDDNIPFEDFFNPPSQPVEEISSKSRWLNVYKLFTDSNVWPRGLPLENILDNNEMEISLPKHRPIVFQGLADSNPDVDAIYRMTGILPLSFNKRTAISLANGTWCPFNSQNTLFLPDAFPLLYLPSNCSFRMTDIWRSFIAQRCLWEMDSSLAFHSATVYQERNEHSLLKDFSDEIPGYLLNNKIVDILEKLDLRGDVMENLLNCYVALADADIFPAVEIKLVEGWLKELSGVKKV